MGRKISMCATTPPERRKRRSLFRRIFDAVMKRVSAMQNATFGV
jgi:hypothetical protein